jgi:CheY-like chemotaxis protein
MADAVLVVGDDRSARAMLVRQLHLEGFAPITAPNGLEALRFLEAGGPAKVILLDLGMPVMDGWTFRRRQRANPRLTHIPVVVVASDPAQPVEELDADAVLQKPLDIREVVRTIRELCPQGGPV